MCDQRKFLFEKYPLMITRKLASQPLDMSDNPDQLVEKYLKMKTKMNKPRKVSVMNNGSGSHGLGKSMKSIEIKDLEGEKDMKMPIQDKENDKCCDLGPVDWPDDDPRWGNPPTIGSPTIIHAKFLIGQLQDLDTVRGTIYVRIGVWCDWKDHRLAGRSRMDPLPHNLWSPRLTVSESLGDFNRRTCEFTLTIGTLDGHLYTLTWYEGTIKNPMDLRLFPLDVDTLHITFFASECYRLNGQINVNYKTDYRLLFEGWSFSPPKATPYGWDLVSSKVLYTFHDHCQDVLQIQLNFKRCTNFYFFKVVFPLLLITCLNFMGFSLEDENLGERLANNISLFLSALALLYVVGQDLPKTTFLTAIDRIVVVTLSLIFVTSIHFVILSHGEHALKKSLAVAVTAVQNVTNTTSEPNLSINQTVSQEDEYLKHEHDYKVVLPYFFGYLAYIIIEFLILLFLRIKHCWEFKKNLDKEGVFLDGIEDHNECIRKDVTYKLPAYLMIDPYKLVLMKKDDPRALLLPQLLTKIDLPVQLFLPTSGKAVVMSARPAYQHAGKDVQWVTLGSSVRALEVVYDMNLNIRVSLF